MKTTLETLHTASIQAKNLAERALKTPVSSILSLCMLVGITATLISYSQTEVPTQTATVQTQPTLPAVRTLTDTKGRSLEGTILAKSDKSITFQLKANAKTFEIQLDTLSSDDKAFITSLVPAIPAAEKKTAVLVLVDYDDKYSDYAETLNWIRKNNDYEVTLGMLYENEYRLVTHLEMAEIPAEEKNVVLIKSGTDTDNYDILWILKFNPTSGSNGGAAYWDMGNQFNKTQKVVVAASSKGMANKKFYTSMAAFDGKNKETEDTFIGTDDNWVFYTPFLEEKLRPRLLKTIDKKLAESRK